MKNYFIPAFFAVTLISNIALYFYAPKYSEIKPKLEGNATIATSKYIYINEELESLDESEKIGQTLIISISGTQFTQDTENILNTIKPGGIILFDSNIISAEQTQKLTNDLQEWASKNDLPPLFICVDQEGGLVQRVDFAPVRYDQQTLGSINSEQETRNTVQETANQLNNIGINVNFAPVADIAYTQDSIMYFRSFGSTPEIVADHTGWTIDEYNQNQILSTAKHFPGHGRTTIDSHFSAPRVLISYDEWLGSDAIPFIRAIENNVPIIMIGHIEYPLITPGISSTSEFWIKNVLRENLGFKGLIVTDDIKMGATGGDFNSFSVTALNSGNDMLIAALFDEDLLSLHEYLIINYTGKEDSLDEKIYRILEYKYDLEE